MGSTAMSSGAHAMCSSVRINAVISKLGFYRSSLL